MVKEISKSNTTKKDVLIFWVKWLSTFMALGCATTSSFDLYPYNVWLGFLAGVGWTWVGWAWKEWALITINAGLTVIYGFGVIGAYV